MARKPNPDKWKSNLYLNAYCYNRGGVVYTSVNHQRRATNLLWIPENRSKAIGLLNERVENYNPNMKRITELFALFKELKFKQLSEARHSQLTNSMITLITHDYYCTENKLISNMVINNVRKSKLSNSYIRLLLGSAREVFKLGIEYEYCKNNPIHLSIFPKSDKKRIDSFSKKEIGLLLDHFNDSEMGRLIRLLTLTGLRVNEALSIKSEDIKDNYLIVHGKGKDRTFPIDAIPEVKQYLKPFNITSVHYKFRYAMKKLGIYKKERGFHGIRKYAINTYIQKGITPAVASSLFGHTIQVMERYYLEIIGHEKLSEMVKNQLDSTQILHK